MNVKEELIQVMGHIAEQFHTDRIAVIVCCEGNAFCNQGWRDD